MSFLPGMFPAMLGQLLTLTYLGRVTSATTSVDVSTLSAGTRQAGDLCLFYNIAIDSSDPTDVTPSGFTSLIHELNLNARARISAKILTGSETTLSGISGNQVNYIVALVFRPSVPLSAWALGATNSEITAGDPVSQTIASSSATTYPVLAFGHMGSNGSVDPRTRSPTMSEIAGDTTTFYTHYKIYNSGDLLSNHSYDMDDEGAQNMLQSSYLTLT